jgi:hypothetical protein
VIAVMVALLAKSCMFSVSVDVPVIVSVPAKAATLIVLLPPCDMMVSLVPLSTLIVELAAKRFKCLMRSVAVSHGRVGAVCDQSLVRTCTSNELVSSACACRNFVRSGAEGYAVSACVSYVDDIIAGVV